MPPQQKADPYASLPDVGAATSDPYASLPDAVAAAPAPSAPPQGAIERYARGFNRTITGAETPQELGSNIAPLLDPRKAGTTAMNFVEDTLQSIPEQSQQLTERAQQEVSTGHPIKAFFHQAAADIPLFGPALSSAADEMAGGNIAGGLGSATAIALPVAGPKAVELAPRAVRAGVDTAVNTTRSLTGTAPRTLKPLVESTEKSNTRIGDINTKRAEMNASAAAKVDEANKQARAAADTTNKERAAAHKENTQEALHETAGRELTHKQAVASKAEEMRTQEAGEAAKLEKDYQDELTKVRSANEAAEKAAADKNATAQAKYEAQVAHHKALSEATEHLNADDRSLKSQLKQVYDSTKTEANAKYEALKGKLAGLSADPEFLPNALVDASGKMRGSETVPTILKDMENRIKHGDIPTFDDLQGYRSEIGRELQRSLPDDVYYAYKGLLENIDDEMARMARSKSPALAKQLSEARDYYRRYAQAFLDRGSPLRKALDDPEAHGFLRRVRGKEISGVEAIRQFNPQLADATQGALSLADEIRAPRGRSPLESPKPVGEAPAPTKARTTQEPSRPAPRLTAGSPESRATQYVKPPERVEPPDRPPVAVAEQKPAPTPKQPLPKKSIDVSDIEKAKGKGLVKRAESLRGSHSPIVSSIAAYDAIRSGLEGNWSRVALDLGARALYGAGKSGLARLLEQPSVAEFLTRATAEDVAAIPLALRGPMAQLISQAKAKGVQVSPSLAGIVAVGTGMGIAPRKHPSDEYAGH